MPVMRNECRKYVTEITELSFSEEEVIQALVNFYNLPENYAGIALAEGIKLITYDNDKTELPVVLSAWYEYQSGEF